MSKKPKRRKPPGGWPKAQAAPPERKIGAIIDSVALRLASGKLGEQDFERMLRRLVELLRTDPSLRIVRPEIGAFEDAVRDLPEADQQAMLQRSGSKARLRRARAKVFPKLFDERLLAEVNGALQRALHPTSPREDVEAIALGLFWVGRAREEGAEIGDNLLLRVLTDLLLVETVELQEAVSTLVVPPEAEGQAESLTDAERARRFRDAMARHPILRVQYERQLHRDIARLFEQVADGTLQAHLTPEDLGPLYEGLQVFIRASLADHPDEAVMERQLSEEFMGRIIAFAEDPANAGAYDRFAAALEAEAEAAQASDDPRARELKSLAMTWGAVGKQSSNLRTLICEASLMRLRREEETGHAE